MTQRQAHALCGGSEAAALPMNVRGIVEHGDKRGRLMGFPTANLSAGSMPNLAYGVYASTTRIGAGTRIHKSISSYGTRPTFHGASPRLETYILDFDGDIYGATISVKLVQFVRPERYFASVAELVAAMGHDLETVRAISFA